MPLISSDTHKEPLHLPRRQAVFQLLGKLIWIGGGIERFELQTRRGLMMAVVVVRDGMVSNDYIGMQLSDLQNHAA